MSPWTAYILIGVAVNAPTLRDKAMMQYAIRNAGLHRFPRGLMIFLAFIAFVICVAIWPLIVIGSLIL